MKNIFCFSWICYKSGFPNFYLSISQTLSVDTTNSFSLLSDIHSTNGEAENMHPKTLTPTKHTTSNRKTPTIENWKHGLKAMIINCNSTKSTTKQAAFWATIDQHQPEIILGCESKLDNNMATYELFPDNCTVCCKDCNASGRGVFIATKNSIITSGNSVNMVTLFGQACSLPTQNCYICTYIYTPGNKTSGNMLSFRNANTGDLCINLRVSGSQRIVCVNQRMSGYKRIVHKSEYFTSLTRIKITLDQLQFPIHCTCTIKWYTDMLI